MIFFEFRERVLYKRTQYQEVIFEILNNISMINTHTHSTDTVQHCTKTIKYDTYILCVRNINNYIFY